MGCLRQFLQLYLTFFAAYSTSIAWFTVCLHSENGKCIYTLGSAAHHLFQDEKNFKMVTRNGALILYNCQFSGISHLPSSFVLEFVVSVSNGSCSFIMIMKEFWSLCLLRTWQTLYELDGIFIFFSVMFERVFWASKSSLNVWLDFTHEYMISI